MVFLLAVIAIILLVALLPEVAAALAVVAFWIVAGALGLALVLAIIAIVVGLPRLTRMNGGHIFRRRLSAGCC
jgi:hypothetical protein